MNELSAEQKAVVQADTQRFAVRAGAGSGKTSVLVERYVRHVIELGYSPDEIVTLTFTRKAAAEMKKRIVTSLRAADRHDDAQKAETGPVQTIHSFCERVLRENSIEAGIDPEFEVIQGPGATDVTQRAVTQAFLAAKDGSDWAAAFVYRYSGKGSFTGPAATHSRLRESVTRLLSKLRASGWDRSQLTDLYQSPESLIAFWAREALKDIPEALFTLQTIGQPDWSKVLADILTQNRLKPPAWLKGHDPVSDKFSAEDTCGLVWLAVAAWDFAESRMEAEQKFDFALLEAKAVRLLETSEAVRDRLRQQARLILIDEAQDLNPVQYRIIDTLSADSEMMVGDPRQSIYGFRFADRRLFVSRCERDLTYELTTNYRSEPGILNFVDLVFNPVPGFNSPKGATVAMGDDPFATESTSTYDGVELWPTDAKDMGTVAQLVNQMVQEGTEPKSIAVLARNNSPLNLLADKLKLLGVPVRTVGASERFYTRLEVRDLANALEALADPYEDFPLLALLRGPMVSLSLDTVTYLAAHKPVIEAIEAEGPWPPDDQQKLTAFRAWFDRARETVDRVPAWETLSLLLRETPYLESVARSSRARQSLANVRKLFTIAAGEPSLNAREFASMTRDIQFLRHREGDAPLVDESDEAVTLMTVHKSKGLEFDVVVLADTHTKLARTRQEVEVDATRGLVVTGMRKPVSVFHRWLSDQQQVNDREEELRVLYVAMTRARKRLCVVVSEEGGTDSAASLIAQRSGLPKNVLPGARVRRLDPGR